MCQFGLFWVVGRTGVVFFFRLVSKTNEKHCRFFYRIFFRCYVGIKAIRKLYYNVAYMGITTLLYQIGLLFSVSQFLINNGYDEKFVDFPLNSS